MDSFAADHLRSGSLPHDITSTKTRCKTTVKPAHDFQSSCLDLKKKKKPKIVKIKILSHFSNYVL